jgi:hypothetical protein
MIYLTTFSKRLEVGKIYSLYVIDLKIQNSKNISKLQK